MSRAKTTTAKRAPGGADEGAGEAAGGAVGGPAGGPAGGAAGAGGAGSDAPAPMAIDEVLRGLERVVTELEGGELPLETALERFEAGVRLAREGGRLLDRIEARVEVLLADRDEAVPFHDPQAAEESDDDDDF